MQCPLIYITAFLGFTARRPVYWYVCFPHAMLFETHLSSLASMATDRTNLDHYILFMALQLISPQQRKNRCERKELPTHTVLQIFDAPQPNSAYLVIIDQSFPPYNCIQIRFINHRLIHWTHQLIIMPHPKLNNRHLLPSPRLLACLACPLTWRHQWACQHVTGSPLNAIPDVRSNLPGNHSHTLRSMRPLLLRYAIFFKKRTSNQKGHIYTYIHTTQT